MLEVVAFGKRDMETGWMGEAIALFCYYSWNTIGL